MKKTTYLMFAILAGCVPTQPTQPSYFGQGQAPPPAQAGYGQPQQQPQQPYQPQQAYVSTNAQASCSETLQCYGQCNPLTEACLQTCDARTQPASAQSAHAVLQCMAQNRCQDQNCVAQHCTNEIATCTNVTLAAPSTPAPAASGGSYDLVYQIPQGWNESRTYSNAITLGFDKEDFYDHLHPRIHVFPSRARQGTINEQFNALWNEIVVAPGEFQAMEAPGPLRRRTASGYAMALDGNNTNLAKGNGFVIVNLYVVYTDDKAIPILATNLTFQFEKVAAAFFDGIAIRGEQPSRTPLFTPAELAGHWSTQSVSVANRVSSSGQVVGDASTATSDDITLDASGAYKSHFVGYNSGRAFQQDESGTWTVEDDMLVLKTSRRTEKRRIWAYGVAPRNVPDSICTVPYGDLQPRYFSPKDGINSKWFGRVK